MALLEYGQSRKQVNFLRTGRVAESVERNERSVCRMYDEPGVWLLSMFFSQET
jgi:hypothetical protein